MDMFVLLLLFVSCALAVPQPQQGATVSTTLTSTAQQPTISRTSVTPTVSTTSPKRTITITTFTTTVVLTAQQPEPTPKTLLIPDAFESVIEGETFTLIPLTAISKIPGLREVTPVSASVVTVSVTAPVSFTSMVGPPATAEDTEIETVYVTVTLSPTWMVGSPATAEDTETETVHVTASGSGALVVFPPEVTGVGGGLARRDPVEPVNSVIDATFISLAIPPHLEARQQWSRTVPWRGTKTAPAREGPRTTAPPGYSMDAEEASSQLSTSLEAEKSSRSSLWSSLDAESSSVNDDEYISSVQQDNRDATATTTATTTVLPMDGQGLPADAFESVIDGKTLTLVPLGATGQIPQLPGEVDPSPVPDKSTTTTTAIVKTTTTMKAVPPTTTAAATVKTTTTKRVAPTRGVRPTKSFTFTPPLKTVGAPTTLQTMASGAKAKVLQVRATPLQEDGSHRTQNQDQNQIYQIPNKQIVNHGDPSPRPRVSLTRHPKPSRNDNTPPAAEQNHLPN